MAEAAAVVGAAEVRFSARRAGETDKDVGFMKREPRSLVTVPPAHAQEVPQFAKSK